MLVKHGMGLVSGDTDCCLNIRLLLYIRQNTNTLLEDIQDTIHKYKHQLEFSEVMSELKCSVCYCRWCGSKHFAWIVCNCMDDCDDYDDSAFDYASHSEYYDDTDSDSYYPVTTR